MDGLPLTIQIAGRLLATEHSSYGFNISALMEELIEGVNLLEATVPIDRLETGEETPPTVAMVLAKSVSRLSEDIQKRFTFLGVFASKPITFGQDDVQAVWDVPDARPTLRALIDRGLVEHVGNGRYQMHSLLIKYAYSLLVQPYEAKMRHAKHYQTILQEAEKVYCLGNENIEEGLRQLDLNWTNIQKAILWAISNAQDDKVAASLCPMYAAHNKLLVLRLQPNIHIKLLQTAREVFEIQGNEPEIPRLLMRLANIHHDQYQSEEALQCYEQALNIAIEKGDQSLMSGCLGGIGNVYKMLEPRQAFSYYERAVVAAQKANNRRNEGGWLGSLGTVYKKLGNLEKAMECYQGALAIAQELGNPKDEGLWLNSIAELYQLLGDFENMMACANQALKLTRKLGDKRDESLVLGNMGFLLYKMGELKQAASYCEQAIALCSETGNLIAEADSLDTLGLIAQVDGQTEQAKYYHQKALTIAQEIGNKEKEAEYSGNLAELYEDTDPAQTVALMSIKVAYLQNNNHPDLEEYMKRVEEIRKHVKKDNK